MIHELKILPVYFQPVADGRKTFEIRLNDREFNVGDEILLKEWSPLSRVYTGRELFAIISYVFPLKDFPAVTGGIDTKFVILGIYSEYREEYAPNDFRKIKEMGWDNIWHSRRLIDRIDRDYLFKMDDDTTPVDVDLTGLEKDEKNDDEHSSIHCISNRAGSKLVSVRRDVDDD